MKSFLTAMFIATASPALAAGCYDPAPNTAENIAFERLKSEIGVDGNHVTFLAGMKAETAFPDEYCVYHVRGQFGSTKGFGVFSSIVNVETNQTEIAIMFN